MRYCIDQFMVNVTYFAPLRVLIEWNNPSYTTELKVFFNPVFTVLNWIKVHYSIVGTNGRFKSKKGLAIAANVKTRDNKGLFVKTPITPHSLDSVRDVPAQQEIQPVSGSIHHVEAIPPPVKAPNYSQLTEIPSSVSYVFFDLETTSLRKDCGITQIAGCHEDSKFNVFVLPDQAIDPAASKVTGIYVKDNELTHNGKVVPAFHTHEALKMFLAWLTDRSPVILCAHNAKNFDSSRLASNIKACGMSNQFLSVVKGYIDTLPFYKKVYPGRGGHKLADVVKKATGSANFAQHDAAADAAALQRAVFASTAASTNKPSTFPSALHPFSFSYMATMEQLNRDKACKQGISTLKHLTTKPSPAVLGLGMAKRIASSGLTMNHIKVGLSAR